jgi:CRP-like cAMP-binding protein
LQQFLITHDVRITSGVKRMGASKGENHYGRSLGFRDLKDTNAPWREVLHLGRQRKLVKGESVQQGKELLFLARGKVYLMLQNQEGLEKIVWYVREGCIFAEAPFFDPIPNEGSLICATDCVVYAFAARTVERIGKERPDLLINLFQSMARQMRLMSYHASSLYLDDGLARICKFLAERIVPGSNPLTAKIGMSRQEMANLLGMHRISLYRVLRRQQERGLFGKSVRGAMTILRPHEFYKLAEA